jgi:hypothetical protein
MSSCKPFLILFAGAVLLLAAAGVALAVMVHRSGVLVVEVHPVEGAGGDRVSLRVPGFLVTTASAFVPRHALQDAQSDLKRWGPLARQACQRLSQGPDCVLVEIDGPREQVRIAKQDRNLVVDVLDSQERVHLVIPLAVANSVLRRFAGA